MFPHSDPLESSKNAILIAYAHAGLGHLRVADALRHALPEDSEPILLVTQDDSIRSIHRIISVHPWAKALMEWIQHGTPEKWFTRFYRRALRADAMPLMQRLYDIYEQQLEPPKRLVVVATHFGLAHQIAWIKDRFEKKYNVSIVLVVQVTDDSPQRIWYVEGADVIVVPSELTKRSLQEYAVKEKLKAVPFAVIPYPLDPDLTATLEQEKFQNRVTQFSDKSDLPIQVAVPVSGAAVGTMFLGSLMQNLARFSRRFRFHLVIKDSIHTKFFIMQMNRRHDVEVLTSHSDREVVKSYRTLYQQTVIALEVTKPSEQAFKALMQPTDIGGSILLFTEPVGRQEYDNLDFLQRHNLIPIKEINDKLTSWAAENRPMSPEEKQLIWPLAAHWRGVRIPRNPQEAAQFIWWCYLEGLFSQMLNCTSTAALDDAFPHEVTDDGAQQFWQVVSKFALESAQSK